MIQVINVKKIENKHRALTTMNIMILSLKMRKKNWSDLHEVSEP